MTPKPGNVGDILTPVILRAFGFDPKWVAIEAADVLATGSICGKALPRHTIWGSGIMHAKDSPNRMARYLAVRGPITRAVVRSCGGSCPGVYGDPALLLPRFHAGDVATAHDLGVVPHYVDRDLVDSDRYHIIDPIRANPLEVVDDIRRCRRIVSSSLHGIIIAHAYGIPAAWVQLSDRLCGDGVKFADFALSTGIKLMPWRDIEVAARATVLGHRDTQPLLDALEALR